MRLPDSAHTTRPWRIHELTEDFELEDVWLVPGELRRERFPRFIELLAQTDPGASSSLPVRLLFRLRWLLGSLFGWDSETEGVGSRVPTLADRMPADLRAADRGPELADAPFASLYLLDDEFAAELANRTVHGVMHFGLVEVDGASRVQMAVLVKPNGSLGRAYLLTIKPFRHLVVYPRLLDQLGALARRASSEDRVGP
jgi:hypothetical protein